MRLINPFVETFRWNVSKQTGYERTKYNRLSSTL
jgi:hypothetical protein